MNSAFQQYARDFSIEAKNSKTIQLPLPLLGYWRTTSLIFERRAKIRRPILNRLPRRRGGGKRNEASEVHCWGNKFQCSVHPHRHHRLALLARNLVLLALSTILQMFLLVTCVIQSLLECYSRNALTSLSRIRKQM